MPIVGIGESPRDPGRQLRGYAFDDHGKGARLGHGECIGEQDLLGALHLVGPQPADGLRRQPDVRHHGNLGLDHGLDRRGHLLPALQLHRLTARLLQDPSRRTDRLPARDLVAEERQVGHDQRPAPRERPSRRGRSPGRASRPGWFPGRGPSFPSSRPPAGNRLRPRQAAGRWESRRRSGPRSCGPALSTRRSLEW